MSVTLKEQMELIERLNKDIKKCSLTLGRDEARYLVDMYYQVQKYRIAVQAQIRSIKQAEGETEEPHEVLTYVLGQFETMESNIKDILKVFVEQQPIGRWMLSITGIGPVISAGMIAHIDISKVQTAGQIQAFAGLDPTKTWEKGQKRPWNAKLKTLCWKAAQSFVKVSNNPNDIYGKIYKAKKEYYTKKNEAGGFADRAKKLLESKKFGKDTESYKAALEGKLSKGHIENMSERYAVKIFLSHLFEVWYYMYHGEKSPRPYEEAILGHAHIIKPPSIDEIEKFM